MSSKFRYRIDIALGVLLIIFSILILLFDIKNIIFSEQVEIYFGRFSGLGFLLFAIGIVTTISGFLEKLNNMLKSTKEKINENDERNIVIENTAKAYTFEFMSSLFFLAILSLSILGYLNKISFFAFVICYLISQIFRIYQLYIINKKM